MEKARDEAETTINPFAKEQGEIIAWKAGRNQRIAYRRDAKPAWIFPSC